MRVHMHNESLLIMKQFVDRYLHRDKELKILDVGSFDVNGNYKYIFDSPKWTYIGLDIAPGPNVDVVSASEYDFGLDSNSFDVVISGNTAEHVKDIFSWIKEIARVTKPSGIVCIITPTWIHEHKHPTDCWRIMPDGMSYLFEIANLEKQEVQIVKTIHGDIVGVAKKRIV